MKYICPSLSGNCPVPYAVASLTINGGRYSVYPTAVLKSRKYWINDLCNFAPLPLYKGKPLPVIFAPVSKSTISYFFISSQCGTASLGSVGSFPPALTTILSAGVFPGGTLSDGRFGSFTNTSCNCFSTIASLSEIGCNDDLSVATSCFLFSASSFCPLAINCPISLEVLFTFACVLSNSSCNFFLSSSNKRISSTRFNSAKFLTANLCFTSSLLFLIYATCNINFQFVRSTPSERKGNCLL